MLGIAQICHEFQVISHHKESQTAFRAIIQLADFLREKVKDISPDQNPERPIDVGRFDVDEIDYDPDSAGTYMIASDMRSAFVKKFRDSSGSDPLPSKFSEFFKGGSPCPLCKIPQRVLANDLGTNCGLSTSL